MATNFIQAGNNLTIPAPATVVGGMPVYAGSIKGIAAGDAASGADVDVITVGVFTLSKVAIDIVTLGLAIYWDATAELATIDAGGGSNPQIGVAVEAAAGSTGTVKVRLSAF
jgi:predicted RecA/RadA family phage recombinase